MSQSKPEPEFPEPHDSEKRAQKLIQEEGGLPDDNAFTEVVEDLRADGKSWDDIFWVMDDVYSIVDKAAGEERTTMIAEWNVTVKVPDENTPSGYRYESHERTAETAEEAEKMVSEWSGYEVVEEKTEQTGYGKYS